MRRTPVLALLLSVALLSATACGRSGDTAAAGQSASAREGGTLVGGPGFNPDTGVITLGILTALTGPVALIGEPLTNGHRVFFDALNAKGGVAGKHKVELVVEDNAYDNPTTVQKYQKIKDQVAMFGQLLGSPQTQALRQTLKADGIVAAPASLDAEWIADLNLLPTFDSSQVQFLNAADWYVKEGGGAGKAICAMVVDNPAGKAAVEGLEAAGKGLGFDIKATVPFKAADQDFTAPVTTLKNAGCQAVFLVTLPSSTGPILGTGAKLGFSPQWIAVSAAFSLGLLGSAQLLPLLQKSFLVARGGPEWGDRSVPGMRRMLADIAAHRPGQAPDLYFVYGYTQAMLVTAFLEKAVALGDLSRPGLLEASRRLGTVEFDGLFGPYTYGEPAQRNPTRTAGIFRVNPAVPGGLETVKANFASDVAKRFSFDRYLNPEKN